MVYQEEPYRFLLFFICTIRIIQYLFKNTLVYTS